MLLCKADKVLTKLEDITTIGSTTTYTALKQSKDKRLRKQTTSQKREKQDNKIQLDPKRQASGTSTSKKKKNALMIDANM